MKNKATPTLHDNDQPNAALAGGNSGARQIFKLGLDVDLNNAVTAIQCGAGDIKRGQSFSRARLLDWVRTQVKAGHTVHTVYEACGFGYTLHHELVGGGAHSLVTTPMRHTAQRRRKNDRMDARELCVRLARWLDGHRDELKPIRIPSSQEQQRRELGRQREFFKREQLEPIVTQIRACRAQLVKLSTALEARVAEQMIPTGLGSLTLALLDGEVCNWDRFKHRKAIGSYTGCCPSEYSTGGVQRFGPIDRQGNKHVRVLLVEAVWRLLKWQPGWHARKKYLARLKHGASLKKKTAVALARQLAIDLWRWRTGRATAAELGWTLKNAREETTPL